jgi:sulfopyruvate decarboxylase TPP-binding subunit
MAQRDAKGRELADFVCKSAVLASALSARCDWFAAVPDSVIKRTIPLLSPLLLAPRENHAIGAAFGAALGGRRPCVLMQNSGLGLCLDALLGLFRLYGQGLVLVVSNRGELAWEEIQHRDWAGLTGPLLCAAGIAAFDFQELGLGAVTAAADTAFIADQPAAILVHRGNLDE